LGDRSTVGADDELNIDELLDTPSKPKEKAPVPPPKEAKPKIQTDTSVVIYPEDNINDLKNKIYTLTGILPFKQHLFIKHKEICIPLKYKIIADGIVDINIQKQLPTTVNKIASIPIDIDMYTNHDILQIEADDYFVSLGELYNLHGETDIYVVNLDEFKIQEQVAQLGKFQQDMVYYGFILKYWPMLSKDAFLMYVTGQKISESFPALDFPKITTRLKAEHSLLKEKYDLLEDAINGYPKHPGFKEFNPFQTSHMLQPKITSLIKSSVIETKNARIPILDMKLLFDSLETSIDVPVIKINLLIDGKPYYLTKIFRGKETVFENYKMKLTLPYYDMASLLLVKWDQKKEKILKATVLIIDKYGQHFVRSYWETEKVSFTDIFKMVPQEVNPYLEIINTKGRSVFLSNIRLPYVKKYYSGFSKIEAYINWERSMSNSEFHSLIKDGFERDFNAGIFGDLEQEADYQIKFKLLKGVIPHKKEPMDYSYLVDKKYSAKLEEIIKTKEIVISLQTMGLRIEVADLSEREFKYFYQYIITRLYTESKTKIKKPAREEHVAKATLQHLKSLKNRDPVLYNFKEHNSKIVYSRICQKNRQPVMYLPDEYKSLPRAQADKMVKYWNFTTNSPVYYSCPNPRYPYLNFLPKYHPKNYCIPCCNISNPQITNEGKRSNVFNTCLEQHTYEDVVMASRYVMTYGKILEPDRVGRLPQFFEKFINNNIEHIDANLEGSVIFEGTKYSVKKLWKVTRNNKIRDVNASSLFKFLTQKSWSYRISHEHDYSPMEIIKNPKLSPLHANRIKTADIKFPILLHNDGNEIKIIDGLHRLARAYIDKTKVVRTRNVTKKQLKKAVSTSTPQKEELKRLGYYLYGVPQNTQYAHEIGAVYSFAVVLDMELSEFLRGVIQKLRAEPAKFNYLLDGHVKKYFATVEDLVSGIIGLNAPLKEPFILWNELFIDIMRFYFDIYTLLFDDSVEDTAASKVQVQSDINIILPNISNIEDLFPVPTIENPVFRRYVVMFRKYKKSKAIFAHNYAYSLMFTITLHEFFKQKAVNKRMYTHEDQFIKLMKSVLEQKISQSRKIEPEKVYINNSGFSYYGVYSRGANKIVAPLEYKREFDANKVQQLQVKRKKIKQTHGDVLYILQQQNIEPKNIIVYNGKAIGVRAGGNYYFKPIPVYAARRIFGIDETFEYIYDPDKINEEIGKPTPAVPTEIYSLLYKKYLYNLLVLELMEYFDSERNKPERKRLLSLLSSINLRDTNQISEAKKNLEHPDVIELIDDAQKHLDRELLINQFNSRVFGFDSITINKLRYEKDKTRVFKILADVAAKITITPQKPEFSGNPIPCSNSDEAHCKKHKLMIAAGDLNKLLEIFTADILNPLKREYLLATMFRFKTLNKFGFVKRETEKIYIDL
jgi:hypothetical protein